MSFSAAFLAREWLSRETISNCLFALLFYAIYRKIPASSEGYNPAL